MQKVVQVDTREQKNHVTRYLNARNIPNVRCKVYVGDYTLLGDQSVCVDRKQHLQEVCGNLCQQHVRFRAELERARAAGIKMVILIEHGGEIKTLADVRGWENPRLKTSPLAMSGEAMHKRMVTIQNKYGVEWMFCRKTETGAKICELLGIETQEG